MARWKLATAHYLQTNGVEWEYNETDRSTGRPARRRFPVPLYLNPSDPADWNYSWGPKDNADGEVIVCHSGKGEPKDIVFIGDPTPDMIPMDDEAREISASFEERWRYKPDIDMPGNYSQSLVDQFQEEMAEAETRPVQIEGLSELVQAMNASVQQNQELIKALANRRV